MTEQELIDFLRIEGRYEITSLGGQFIARPINSEDIIISLRSHQECKEYYSKAGN